MNRDQREWAESYDPSVARDNTGYAFKSTTKEKRKLEIDLFRNPELLTCPQCGCEQWTILADNHPESGLVQFMCKQCKSATHAFELRKPQMDDVRAKKLGLWVPNDMVAIDMEVDIER